ncbi:hypothetical protein J6590_092039 [Homalodisca vitripennis]|nr:hypothetical protein J6590_092039 [Homalodisca vitripennis]
MSNPGRVGLPVDQQTSDVTAATLISAPFVIWYPYICVAVAVAVDRRACPTRISDNNVTAVSQRSSFILPMYLRPAFH